MLVVDTSAVVNALVGSPPDRRLVARLAADGDLHAPHLLDVELLHTLRRLVTTARLTEDRAADARTDFADLTIVRYPHHPLADRVWALRHNLTAYDATFVALSEALGVPLVTCDARLAAAPGHQARVELFGSSRSDPGG
jgi:predicted nucleic acid-binding protein